ncbi:unnamed protein product [Protopolystoma xenopodis]|uniref:G-protein coupled receptors family 1 profile domain-containing protein n=1 Tax=Protopolystoma xenopodis TaxID=117903 RepID=A0A3S4ZPH4_9PLAT|nr:unnamed protein product [Protopolystoma xenopodis]
MTLFICLLTTGRVSRISSLPVSGATLAYFVSEATTNSPTVADDDASNSTKIKLWSFLMACMGVAIFVGNCLVVAAVATTRRLQTVTNLYVVSLAIADLLVAILVLPASIAYFMSDRWPFDNHTTCYLWLSADILLCTASILNLCCISLDRYMAVTRPLDYTTRRTRRTASLMIIAAWLLSGLIVLPGLFGGVQHNIGRGRCSISVEVGFRVYSSIGSFFGPFFVMLFVYTRIFVVACRRLETFGAGSFNGSTSFGAGSTRHKKGIMGRRDAIQSFTLFGVFASIRSHLSPSPSTHTNIRPSEQASLRNSEKDSPLLARKVTAAAVLTYSTSKKMDLKQPTSAALLTSESNRYSMLDWECQELRPSSLARRTKSCMALLELMTENHALSNSHPMLQRQEIPVTSKKPCLLLHVKTRNFSLDSPQNSSTSYTQYSYFAHNKSDISESCQAKPHMNKHFSSMPCIRPLLSNGIWLSQSSTCDCVFWPCLLACDQPQETIPEYLCRPVETQFTQVVGQSEKASSTTVPKFSSGMMESSHKRPLRNVPTARISSDKRLRERAAFKRERKTAKTLGCVVGCFSVFWLPFFISYIFEPFCLCRYPSWFVTFVTWLGYVNSVFNPFIYAFYNREYANAFKRILRIQTK